MAETATILVTDLVDSTATRVRLGEDRAEQLRRDHDSLLVEQAGAHGGNVIKGLGDGLLVAFSGAAEALAAAVAMQQALEGYGRREGLTLAMRVGVSAGDVTFEDGDCFGTPVIEASRLCGEAAPGQILLAQLVRLLAGARGDFAFTPLGPTELKGLPEPLDVLELGWEPVQRSTGLRTRTPFVGRERERDTLRQCWELAAGGEGGVALISGEPGIGKTRLVNELCEQLVQPAGGVVLIGGCHDGDVVANAPIVEALTAWIRHTDADDAREILGSDAAVVARMVPAIQDRLPEIDEPLPATPDAETARSRDAVTQVLLRLAERAPVVLVLDDLHWADEASVGMLRAICRAARGSRLLVVGTFRETDIDRRHPFATALAVMQRETEPARIVLTGLDATAVNTLLTRLAEHEVPEELSTLLAAETEGNPFFLRETLLHLIEEGRLRFEGGQWTVGDDLSQLGVPAGIRDVIGRRLSRLGDAANRLLAAGALFEVSFPLPVAAEVVGLDDDEALDAIDQALEARIVRATEEFDHYAFTHALFRHALVEELNPSRQVRMHRAIATALEKQLRGEPAPATAAALARHYHRSAALPNAEQGVPYAVAVADDAGRRYAKHEEYAALLVALELLAEGDDRSVELGRRLTNAAVFTQIGAEEVLRVVETTAREIEAAQGADAACDFVADLAMTSASLEDIRLVWRVGALGRRWLRPDRRDATYVVLRALELMQCNFEDPDNPGIPLDTPESRELGETMRRVPPAELAGAVWLQLGSRSEAQRSYESFVVDRSVDAMWSRWPITQLWVLGAHRELVAELSRMHDSALERGVLPLVVLSLAMQARALTVLGEHDACDAAIDEGMALVPRIADTSNATFQLIAAVFLRRLVRGELIASAEIEGLSASEDQPETRWAFLAVRASGGLTLAMEGRADQAMALYRDCLVIADRVAGWAQNYPLILSYLARILWTLESTEGLEDLERNLREKVVEPDVRYPEVDGRWSLAHLCALTGRIDEARTWFEQARRVLTEQESAALLVAVDFDEAEMEIRLAADRDAPRARALLARARAGCTHPAMAPWLPRIDALETRLAQST